MEEDNQQNTSSSLHDFTEDERYKHVNVDRTTEDPQAVHKAMVRLWLLVFAVITVLITSLYVVFFSDLVQDRVVRSPTEQPPQASEQLFPKGEIIYVAQDSAQELQFSSLGEEQSLAASLMLPAAPVSFSESSANNPVQVSVTGDTWLVHSNEGIILNKNSESTDVYTAGSAEKIIDMVLAPNGLSVYFIVQSSQQLDLYKHDVYEMKTERVVDNFATRAQKQTKLVYDLDGFVRFYSIEATGLIEHAYDISLQKITSGAVYASATPERGYTLLPSSPAPDGNAILLINDDGDSTSLVVISLVTKTNRVIATIEDDQALEQAAWSPNSTLLAVSQKAQTPNSPSKLQVIRVGTYEIMEYETGEIVNISQIHWSRRLSYLSYVGDGRIEVIDLENGETLQALGIEADRSSSVGWLIIE